MGGIFPNIQPVQNFIFSKKADSRSFFSVNGKIRENLKHPFW